MSDVPVSDVLALDELSIVNFDAVLSRLPIETHGAFVNLLRDAHTRRVLDGAWTDEGQGASGYVLLTTPAHTKWLQETEAKLRACLRGPDKLPIPAAMVDKALLLKVMLVRREKQTQAPAKPSAAAEAPKGKSKKNTVSGDSGASETMPPGEQDQNAKPDEHVAVA